MEINSEPRNVPQNVGGQSQPTSQIPQPPPLSQPTPSSSGFFQRRIVRLILIICILLLMALLGTGVYYLMKNNTASELPQPQTFVSATLAPAQSYEIFLEGNGSIFATNIHDSEAIKLVSDETLVSISHNGVSYLSKNAQGEYFLRTSDGNKIKMNDRSIMGVWSQNSKLVLIYIMGIPDSNVSPKYELWDTVSMSKVKDIEDTSLGIVIGLFNNGNLLVQRIRSDRSTANIDVYEYDISEEKLVEIGALKVSSKPIRISPDETKLAYSDGDNLRVYNLADRQSEKKTDFSEESQIDETVGDVDWSPNGKYIAFSTFGNLTVGHRIGLINLENNKTYFWDEAMLVNIIKYPEESDGSISNFALLGWELSNKAIVAISEIVLTDKSDLTSKRADRYWLIDIESRKFTELPQLGKYQRVQVTNR